MADVKFEVIQVALPTSGTVDATIPGFGTPSAAIFICGEPTALETSFTRVRGSIGFKQEDSNQWCVGYYSDFGGAVSQAARGQSSSDVLCFQSISGSTAVSFIRYQATRITDGYRLSISSGSSGFSRLCTVVLIGGADVSNARVGNVNLGTGTSGVAVTGLGFEPDLVFGTTAGQGTGAVLISDENIHSFGVAHNGASIEQGCSSISSVDNAATTVCNAYVSNTNFLAQSYNNSLSWTAAVTSFDAGGFTITPASSTNNDQIGYLALKFSNSPDIKVRTVTIPTTGNYAEAGIGFEPSFGLMALSAGPTSFNTLDSGSRSYSYGLSAFDTSSIFTVNGYDEDGLSTQDADSFTSNIFKIMDSDGSVASVASSYAFDADGWDFTLSTNPASVVLGWGLAIGTGGTPGDTYTISLDSGSFTLSGGSLDLLANRLLSLDAGALTTTGGDVDLIANRVLNAEQGNFTLTGGDIEFTVSRVMTLEAGEFTLSGGSLNFVYSPIVGPTYTLNLDAGTYEIAGGSVELNRGYSLELEAGDFTITGGVVNFSYSGSAKVVSILGIQIK